MIGITKRPALTSFSFLSMFFLGVGTAIIGAASKNIGLTPFQIGLLISIQNVGFIVSVVAAGALADSMQKTLVLAAGSFILAVAFFFFYYRQPFVLNLFIMFFVGVGMGTYEGAADALLLDIHHSRQAFIINVNHFFVTFGSLTITLYLIFLQMNWRLSMVQSAAAVGALAVLFFFSRTVKTGGAIAVAAGPVSTVKRFTSVLKKPGAILLFLGAVGGVGIEIGTIGILTTYLMDMRGFNQVTSKLALVTYLSGVACGRLVLGGIVKKEKLFSTVTLLFGLGAVLISLLYFVPAGYWFYYVSLFLLGISFSVILPSIITITGLRYPTEAGTAMGLIKLGIPIGSIVFPFLLSMVSRYAGFTASFFLFPAAGAACFFMFLAGKKRLFL